MTDLAKVSMIPDTMCNNSNSSMFNTMVAHSLVFRADMAVNLYRPMLSSEEQWTNNSLVLGRIPETSTYGLCLQ